MPLPFSRFRIALVAVSVLSFLLSSLNVQATHGYGGQMSYQYLGNKKYEVTLILYRDCDHGNSQAIAEDDPAYIGVYRSNGTLLLTAEVSADSTYHSHGPVYGCDNITENCYDYIRFRHTFTLPDSTGYTIVNQRCCRAYDHVNIENPGGIGATYFCTIPPASAGINNSAVFEEFVPPVVAIGAICTTPNLAADADGDSLSYDFTQSYRGERPIVLN